MANAAQQNEAAPGPVDALRELEGELSDVLQHTLKLHQHHPLWAALHRARAVLAKAEAR